MAFITVHVGINVGSNLQAIATSEVLKAAGYDPILINYIPPRVSYRRYWEEAIKSPIRFIKGLYHFHRFISLTHLFCKYQSQYCKMTPPIYYADDFLKRIPVADIYMTGSDQVWNFIHNEGYDYHYFFEGIKGKKIAYASSIGMSSLKPEEEAILKSRLSEYDKISVRESNAVGLLHEMGIASEQLLDPTLMLNKCQWEKFISSPIVSGPYVLVYHPYNIVDLDAIYEVARKIAKKKTLKVISFLWWERHPLTKADITIFNASPGEFLSLMYNAEYVVTNSFHGTAFSINLNKQFWVLSPSRFASRITSLIDLVGLQGRMISSGLSEEEIDNDINYEEINIILNRERTKAMDFLRAI